jgi:hypothetical protein
LIVATKEHIMAIIFALLGGVFGMVWAVLSLVFFDASILAAVGIWSAVGLASLAIGLALAMHPQRRAQPQGQPETA